MAAACAKQHSRGPGAFASVGVMSAKNGDRARFHKNRKRKLLHRQRVQALITGQRKQVDEPAVLTSAAVGMQDEGGPVRVED
jgi:hypothetical protein